MAGTAALSGTAVSTLGAARSGDPDGPNTANVHSDGDPALLQQIADLVVSGTVRVPLLDVLPFERIDDALRLLSTAPLGKVGLSMGGPAGSAAEVAR
jgi:hypothetical protein